jgi:hypothetical protein
MDSKRINYRTRHYYEILRGRVEGLTGGQGFSLISWARFELGLTTVLMHGFLNLPPRLEDGDQVVVAGFRKKTRFEALACAKLGESDAEFRDRVRAQKHRRTFWVGLLLALVAVPILWAARGGVERWAFWHAASFLLGLIISVASVYLSYSRAEIELELALATGAAEE